MRVLFVSGSPGAGSLRSTDELAQRLHQKGHAVAVLQPAPLGGLRRYLHKRATNLQVKLAGRPPTRIVTTLARRFGRRARPMPSQSVDERWQAPLPENALGAVVARFRPDVVVVSSIDRMAWRQIRGDLAAAGIPSVLYLREETALGHFEVSNAPADLHMANAEVHADRVRALGFECVTIPSVIEVGRCLVDSTRERVLFVNPVDIYGVDTAIALAAARPDVLFAFAESWKLRADERAALVARLESLDNVELRARVDDLAQLYRDARVLLVPYRFNGRPRVVLEAQANGIPVLASDNSALRGAVGPGGVLVDRDAPIAEWAAALDAMLDPECLDELGRRARAHAARAEVDPEQIVASFERAVAGLIDHASTA